MKYLEALLVRCGLTLEVEVPAGLACERYLVRNENEKLLLADVLGVEAENLWNLKCLAQRVCGDRLVKMLMTAGPIDGFCLAVTDLCPTAVRLADVGGKLSEGQIWHLFRQMLDCVADVHEQGFIHTAISENTFYIQSSQLRLAELWFARRPEDSYPAGRQRKLKEFRPDATDCYSSDIYLLGRCLLRLVLGRSSNCQDPESHATICAERPELSTAMHGVIKACLASDPQARPSLQELLAFVNDLPGVRNSSFRLALRQVPGLPINLH